MRNFANPAARFGSVDVMLLVLVAVWGVNYTVIKDAIAGPAAPFTPFAFNAIRFVVAALFLGGVLAWKRHAMIRSPRELLLLFGLGFIGNSLYQMLFILGVGRTSVASGALILATVPVIVALFGALSRTERLAPISWLGIILSVAGIAVVVFASAAGASRESSLAGDLLILASAIVWSVYTVLAAPLLKRYSTTQVTALSLSAGTIPLVLVAIPDLSRTQWSAVPVSAWLAAFFSGTLALAVGYVAWNRGVKHLGGSRTAVYSNLTPLVAAAYAWATRGEAFTRYHLFGAIVVIAGINLTRVGRASSSVPLPAEE
ncbi:MAG: DMT family transporter [bacterium]